MIKKKANLDLNIHFCQSFLYTRGAIEQHEVWATMSFSCEISSEYFFFNEPWR